MSYKQCIFGVPAARVARDRLLADLAATMADLAGDIDLPDVYAAMNDEDHARQAGLRLFGLGRTLQKETMVDRGFVEESLAYGCDVPLVTLLHDDQHGIYLFRYRSLDEAAPSTFLLSDGVKIGGTLKDVTVDYAQKGLSAKAAAKLEDYDSAVSVGLRHHFPRVRAADYLDLLYAREVIHLYSPKKALKKPKVVKTPPGWHNMMAFWPEDWDWTAAKIPQRAY